MESLETGILTKNSIQVHLVPWSLFILSLVLSTEVPLARTKAREYSNYFILLQTFVKSNECCQRPLRSPAGAPRRCNGPLIGPPQ